MKFNLLLFILSVKLKQAAKKNNRFRKFIKDKKLRFGIKTADGKMGRLFVFSNGTITSRSGSLKEADAAMVWSDAGTAFKTMSNSNEEASLAALTEKKLEVEGDLKEFLWFSRGIDIMMGKA
jgi:hypothetical protein